MSTVQSAVIEVPVDLDDAAWDPAERQFQAREIHSRQGEWKMQQKTDHITKEMDRKISENSIVDLSS